MNSWNLGSGSKYTVVTHRTGTQGTTEQREGKFRSLCEGKKKQNREMEEVNQKIRKKKKKQNNTKTHKQINMVGGHKDEYLMGSFLETVRTTLSGVSLGNLRYQSVPSR